MPFDGIKRQGPGPGNGAHERAINLPPAILWIIGLNVAVQLGRELLGEQLDQQLVVQFGLVPLAYSEPSGDWLSLIAAPFTYQFLHGGWVHLGVNMLTLAAFGAPVERLLRPARFVAFYLAAGLAAAAIHVLSFPTSENPVVGASGSISGVFGAVLILLWQVGRLPSLLPVAGVWIVLNVFFGLFGGMPGASGEQIAWTAHIGGFVFGLAAIRLFIPRGPEPQEPPEPPEPPSP